MRTAASSLYPPLHATTPDTVGNVPGPFSPGVLGQRVKMLANMPAFLKDGVALSLQATGHASSAPASAATRFISEDHQLWTGFETAHIPDGLFPGHTRQVHWQVPQGKPPRGGWPVIFLSQGSLLPGRTFFFGREGAQLGEIHQVRTTQKMLDNGVAVVAPETLADGHLFWNTNIPAWAHAYHLSPDFRLFQNIFRAMEEGRLGPMRSRKMGATGISSGGYNTSRLALTFPARFGAVAIHSGGYATNSGSLLTHVPAVLPQNHPPTLFLHGADDPVVPVGPMLKYAKTLQAQGTPVGTVIAPGYGHEWLPGCGDQILHWLQQYGVA